MEIKVESNYLKLLGDTFFHLHNNRNGKVEAGKSYICCTKAYGEVGTVECMTVTTTPLFQLKAMPSLLHNAILTYRAQMPYLAVKDSDIISYCVFRFVKRYNGQFLQLINKECEKIGLELTTQQSLF